MIVFPLIRSVGLKAATASSRAATLPMFVRSRPSQTRWTSSLNWARSGTTTKSIVRPPEGRASVGPVMSPAFVSCCLTLDISLLMFLNSGSVRFLNSTSSFSATRQRIPYQAGATATSTGTATRTSVPAPGLLHIPNCAPMFSARSRIPRRPQTEFLTF